MRPRTLALATLVGMSLLAGCDAGKPEASATATAPAAPAAQAPPAPAAKPAIVPDPSLPPLQAEKVGIIRTLPVPYPPHWVLVHDGAFFHMSDGKVIVLDADAATQPEQYKGMINNAFMGSFATSAKRRELYVAETFYSRGQRGERTDVLTIYDQATLAPVAEVVLPGGKRFSGMPERHALQLIGEDRFALSFNLNPATSVWVVDLEKRELVGEVPTPGCALIYPTGPRGFSSICSDGSFLSYQLDASGKPGKEVRTPASYDIGPDPMFEKPAILGGIAYFPTFLGQMIPVDLRGDSAAPGVAWPLLTEADKAEGWRPGGWQMIDTDAAGKVYMLFHSGGYDGSHKNPGAEIWVYDMGTRSRERRIVLKNPAISLMLTRDEKPLIVTSAVADHGSFMLDVYDATSGEWQRTMNDFGHETPFVVHPGI